MEVYIRIEQPPEHPQILVQEKKRLPFMAAGWLAVVTGVAVALGIACNKASCFPWGLSKLLPDLTAFKIQGKVTHEISKSSVVWDMHYFADPDFEFKPETCANQLFKSPSISDPSLEFLTEYADAVCGNLDFNKSKVIFLSDVHTDNLQRAVREIFLANTLKDRDVLLLEDTNYNSSVSYSEARFIQRNVTVRITGWESETLNRASFNALNQYFKDACRSIDLRKALFEKRANQMDHEASEIQKDLAEAERQENQSSEISSRIDLIFRNEKMTEIIREILPTLSPEQRIFVIAGAGHLDSKLLKQFENDYTALFFKNLPKPVFRKPEKLRAYTIAMPDGSDNILENYWFDAQGEIKVGEEVKLTRHLFSNSPLSYKLKRIFSNLVNKEVLSVPERKYKVIDIPDVLLVNESAYELPC